MRLVPAALAATVVLAGTASASRPPQLDLADFSYAVTARSYLNKTAVCVARGGDAADGWRLAGLGYYRGFDWSPDGGTVAVALTRRFSGPILVARADPSGGLRAISRPRLATEDDSAPKWSPDGRTVAFARTVSFGPRVDYSRGGLWTVDVSTRRERQVSRRFPTDIAWSRGGEHLAARFGEDLSLFTRDGQLEWTISRGEGKRGEVEWSPSGELLAATFGRETLVLTPERTPVATITRPDTELGPLEQGMSWSPDSRLLALGGGVVYDRNGDPAGRYAPESSTEAVAFAPKWTADGAVIVFERARPARIVWRYGNTLVTLAADLYATRLADGSPTALTATPGIDESDVVFRPARGGGTAGTAYACLHVGSARRDVVYGSAQDDLVSAGPGNDLIYGRGGDDLLLAGDGNDVVSAGVGRDVVVGDRGRDRLDTRDRSADLLTGGPGRDRARVDRRDRVTGVESVSRR